MAKATAGRGGGGRGRPPAVTQSPPSGRASYAIEVYQELRKTTWPTGRELRRMTEVVIATVVMFGLLIGGLDALLGVLVKPLYQQIGTGAASSTAQPTFTPVPKSSATPAPSASTSPAASASAAASSPAPTPSRTP